MSDWQDTRPPGPERMPGLIYTFYSYKGGVGRSMALANVGVAMALRGHKVLLVDWDLEAPGLETYFVGEGRTLLRPSQSRGVLDLLESQQKETALDWRQCVMQAEFLGTKLDVIPAGLHDENYRKRVQHLDWKVLYEVHHIGNYVDKLREEWRSEYDFVLVDSRTGITDIGDLCTVVLPDVLVLVFVNNQQNLDGIRQVMQRAVQARSTLPVNRNKLIGVPVLSRDERRSEYEKSLRWRNEIASALEPLYSAWLPKNVTAGEAIDQLFIPYVATWSFGEPIPLVESERERSDPTSLGMAYTRLATLLGERLDWMALVSSQSSQAEIAGTQQELAAVRDELGREKLKLETLEVKARKIRLRYAIASVLAGMALAVVVILYLHATRAGRLPQALSDSSAATRIEGIAKVAAMGADGHLYDVDVLRLLRDPDPGVRRAAIAAAQRLMLRPQSNRSSFSALLRDPVPEVRKEALAVVGFQGNEAEEFTDDIAALLRDEDAALRADAVAALSRMGESSQRHTDTVASLLADTDRRVRTSAAQALGRMDRMGKHFAAVDALRNDDDGEVRATAAEALSRMGMAPQVASFLKDPDPSVRARAVQSLSAMGEDGLRFSASVVELTRDHDAMVRARAVDALADMNPDPSVWRPVLTATLRDKDWKVRVNAVKALGRLHTPLNSTVAEVDRMRRDENDAVAHVAAETLTRMQKASAPGTIAR